MALEQIPIQEQTLHLTQSMRQALRCLELPVGGLCEYLQEAALSNPLLEVETPPPGGPEPAVEPAPVGRQERLIWDGAVSREAADVSEYVSSPVSYREHLDMQLQLMRGLDWDLARLCHYLVGCLNSAGYLDCPLPELAEELGCPLFDLEQALFAVQTLDPPGTGARNLSECLLLQLAEGPAFTAVNIRLVRDGLPLLAKNDYPGLARLLKVSQEEARQAAGVIRSLNPIPSRGFYGDRALPCIQPEASILNDQGRLVVEMNQYGMPRLSLQADYCALLERGDCPDAQPYLREKMTEARGLLSGLESRRETLFRLIRAVAEHQRAYFLEGGALEPLTMKDLAEELSLNVSTVSRAVKDKYIQFDGRAIALRALFCTPVQAHGGGTVSADSARQQIRRFVAAESPGHPLSDEALVQALSGVGITISRRTVAKYRAELEIPPAAVRKRNYAAPE